MEEKIITALSNQVRLKLILCLAKNEKNVTELIENCGLSQSAVSQHLEKLRSAGIVITERKGKEIYYKLTNQKAAKVSNHILTFVQEVAA